MQELTEIYQILGTRETLKQHGMMWLRGAKDFWRILKKIRYSRLAIAFFCEIEYNILVIYYWGIVERRREY